jgi:signal transduction histidine kinase
MTASIMFNIAQGEKQLLSLVNATVSHEMRNPINSISNQILQLQMLNSKTKEVLDSLKSETLENIKGKLE